ncbi:MAG TPA: amino acid adenylation domain-containing protein [Anaerolineae bacterium]|nr:amino acid adenylation domain-containing protein [Anaerolineae bacterium]
MAYWHDSRDLLPFASLVELLRGRTLERPDQRVYTFLVDGETEEIHLTHAELDRQARAIASQLQISGFSGQRVLLLYPPGLDYIAAFFGCLYAGCVAVPAYPPRLNRPAPRLQAIVSDSQAIAALTTATILASLESRFTHTPELANLRWITTDHLDPQLAESWQDFQPGLEQLAFFQYTSGSTAAPKGVMVTHGNLLHNLAQIQRCFEVTADSRGVSWLPPYHDMGLIGGLLQPLYAGAATVFLAPIAFLQQPFRWLQAITRYQATINGGPNFAYELCVAKISAEQRALLDLSHWEVAFTGAEPIRPATLNRFIETFAPCGFRPEMFYPCYGLAEATLIVSGGAKSEAPIARAFRTDALERNQVIAAPTHDAGSRTLVSCGRNLLGQRIAIVDPNTLKPCSPDQIGEIWVSGPSVAQGYWHRTEDTEATFRAALADSGDGPFLRTGDLGFLDDGELFVTGRLKDLIIIRGRNHYPQDIELTVEQSHPSLVLASGAAFSVDVNGEERLVVVQEVERHFKPHAVDGAASAIRQAVADQHELQVYAVVLIRIGTIPKTSSGKIQRRACRAEYLAGSLNVIGGSVLDESAIATAEIDQLQPTREELFAAAPEVRRSRLEIYLQAEIARVLKVAPAGIDPQRPLTSLGLDSLMAVELQHRLESGLGISAPMASFLEGLSIAQLATEALDQLVVSEQGHRAASIAAPATTTAEHPLSYGQRALWFLHQLAPESAAYNIAGAVRIAAALDVPALQRAFQQLVDRHPSLRTTFSLREGEPVQMVRPQAEVFFDIQNASYWTETELHDHLTEAAHRPFDLERGPLLRVHLFARSAQEHVLLLVMHHSVSDLWSLAILVQELGRLYPAEKAGAPLALDPLPIQYTDYARWQAERLAGPQGEQDWAYWQKTLAGELPVLNLPTDHPRPPIQTYHGASQTFQLSPELTRALKALGQEQRATLYMVLLAAFQALLHRYTEQDEVIIGSPTAGRQQAELAGLVGYFVNPVAARSTFSADLTFEALLDQVRQTVLATFEHADYPLALLIERLHLARDLSRSPLFQVMFILQKAPALGDAGLEALALGAQGARLELGGLQLESLSLEQRIAQFDLTLTLGETDGRLAGTFEYNTDLFEAATIDRWIRHFENLLMSVTANPQLRIADAPLLTPAEQQQFTAWNDTCVADVGPASLVELFERQVEHAPEALAVLLPEAETPAADAPNGNHRTNEWRLTYQELNQRANQLAHYLQRLGVGPEDCVGLCLERSLELVVAILGVLKAGGAYVPLDPDYPPERLAFMLKETRANALLTEERLIEAIGPVPFAQDEIQLLYLDRDWPRIAQESQANPASPARPENLACVIYTSGSTGQPKGVLLENRNLVNLVRSFIESYRPGLGDRILPLTAIASASFVGEVLPMLCSGGALVLPDKAEFLDFQKLVALIAQESVTILSTVPSFLAGINALADQLPHLRLMLSGGEALFANQVDRLLDSATVVNGYGLTETTICSTYHFVQPSDLQADTPIPMGQPLRNTQIHILDKNLQKLPVGCIGELYIAGAGLARGYLNDPALTAERFIPNSVLIEGRTGGDAELSSFDLSPSSRLYKTGDLARWLPDGQLEFLGRADHQVKIRGFRIELGEIETRLGQHPAVHEAVVVARDVERTTDNGKTASPDKRLVAYVAPTEDQRRRTKADESVVGRSSFVIELRAFLKEKLPDYMLPSAFILLDRLPLTPNGKVDVKALPLPDSARPELAAAYVAPQSEVERTIAGVWQTILQLDKVGVHDNFFELGGHSLLLVKAHTQLRAAFNRPLSLVDLFKYPTIHSLAQYLSQEQPAAPSFDRIQAVAEKQREARTRRQQLMKESRLSRRSNG